MKGTCEQIPFHFFLKFMMLGIVGGVGGQFNAELLSGIFMGGGAENETAGGIFPNQTGFAGAVLLS